MKTGKLRLRALEFLSQILIDKPADRVEKETPILEEIPQKVALSELSIGDEKTGIRLRGNPDYEYICREKLVSK